MRIWKRLGAAAGVVALLAGGLVGVAAPAQAYHVDESDKACPTSAIVDEGPSDDEFTPEQAAQWEAEADALVAANEYCNNRYENYHAVCYNKEDTVKPGTYYFRCFGFGQVIPQVDINDQNPETSNDYCATYSSQPSYDNRDEEAAIAECVSKNFVEPFVCKIIDFDNDPIGGCTGSLPEALQVAPPPPPCWGASINNCPVGGALRFAAPKYAMVGVPVTMYAYASWRPDANSPAQPTNGTAVIRVDGEDYSGVEFKDGVAEWRFIPETEGMKEFTASGVLFSGLSGANAYIDTVPARTYVLEYDPAAYAAALKKKRVEVGDTYVITDPNQARSYLEDRYAWSVSDKSDDVCAVYETKKGAVKAKFTDSGKCTVIWMDKESEEEGKYSFIAKK